MVFTLIDYRNDVKMFNENFAVKPLACNKWFHLSFEDFNVISMVDKSTDPRLLPETINPRQNPTFRFVYKILRRLRLRGQDFRHFLNTKYGTRATRVILAGKHDALPVLAKMSSGSDGKKLSNLKSFIILRSGEGLTSFNKLK